MPAPRAHTTRRLSLLDLIIAVAMTSVWLAATRAYIPKSNLISIWALGSYGFVRILKNQVGFLLILSSPAMLLIGLRGPRPRRRRLWRQPGLAASMGATAGSLVGVAGEWARWSASLGPPIRDGLRFLYAARPLAAPGVIGAWLVLALTGRWRAERSGIDRLGRLLGVLWLVEFLIAEMPTTRWVAILDNLIRRGFP